MEFVRCINKEKTNNKQLIIGKKYWIDNSTRCNGVDGDEYAEIYLDEEKEKHVGNILTKNFETVYRYLNYGASLSGYVNSNIAFLLKDIIGWCLNNSDHLIAEKLIFYIYDHKLDMPENMGKEFVVNSIPFREYAERGMEEAYMKYMGYSIYCVE